MSIHPVCFQFVQIFPKFLLSFRCYTLLITGKEVQHHVWCDI